MTHLPPETKALRQFVIVALLAFFVGMVGFLVLVTWLMWRFAEPDTPWYDLLHISINALIWSVIAGLALAAGATSLLSWWQHRCGVHPLKADTK
jgi:hypothetical protein